MEVANPNIVIAGVFLATLLIIGSIILVFQMIGGEGKQYRNRLQRFRERFGDAPRQATSRARAVLLGQDVSSTERLLGGMLPRPKELRARLARTGRKISLSQYAGISAALVAVTTAGLIFGAGFQPLLGVLIGIFFGVGMPHYVINRMIDRRIKKFLALFPEAIDLMVRGLKSGLPITESISAVGREVADPVGIEFRRVADDVRLGNQLDQALWKVAERIDIPDFKFFVISLAVQKETGGNLAETLNNLSDILRRRQQMKLKIRAMSSEGRASAMIIGALPFIMFGILLTINYEYASTLYTDPRAIMVSVGGLGWMGIGMLIIKKMINFEI